MVLKQFDKWWNKVSMEGDWDYEEYAKQGWEAALEWIKYEGVIFDDELELIDEELGNDN